MITTGESKKVRFPKYQIIHTRVDLLLPAVSVCFSSRNPNKKGDQTTKKNPKADEAHWLRIPDNSMGFEIPPIGNSLFVRNRHAGVYPFGIRI